MEKMSPLQLAIATLVGTFEKYASADGDSSTLSRDEAKTLLRSEIPEIAKEGCVDSCLAGFDGNSDKKVDFSEFMMMVACLAMGLRSVFVEQKCQ